MGTVGAVPAQGLLAPDELLRVVFDLRTGSVGFDRVDALLGARFRLITLTGGDDLAVRRFQVEAELAGFVFADLEFRSHALTVGNLPELENR